MFLFFGIEIVNSVLYSYSLSFSFLILTIIQPILSGIADYSGNKKFFSENIYVSRFNFLYFLIFFEGDNVEYGIILSVLASIGFTGSLVFYNAFLPEISTPNNFDKISARGYSFGYVGSVILLIICLILIQSFDFFGFESSKEGNQVYFFISWYLVDSICPNNVILPS